ncbi:unnamed protein product [Cuscuta campestris]|uniref:CCHC-type domain-containing protein n=1 Tax=Cuscuta campestris TaxID=132261 RepID=A0A484M6A1_9ASTE|nr:unnamed protein product [Cuscuta campestris]
MMSAVRKLIVAPLSPSNLAPQAGEVIVQIVEDTTAYTSSVVENSSVEPRVEDDRKSGSDVMDTSACARARVVESTYKSECLSAHCPDGVLLIVTDHVPTNGVNGDNHWRNLSILKKVSSGNNVIFYGCTKEFETTAIEAILEETIVWSPNGQMAEEANFNGHLDEFNKITTELESIDVKIEEDDKAVLLLASLPSSFHNIVTTLLFGKETLKFDEVVAALLMNETRWGGNWVSNDGQALVAKGAGRERGRSKERGGVSQRFKSSSKSFRCYYCDEEGHLKRVCPKRRKEKKDGKTPVTAVAESLNQASEEDLFLATTKSRDSPITPKTLFNPTKICNKNITLSVHLRSPITRYEA